MRCISKPLGKDSRPSSKRVSLGRRLFDSSHVGNFSNSSAASAWSSSDAYVVVSFPHATSQRQRSCTYRPVELAEAMVFEERHPNQDVRYRDPTCNLLRIRLAGPHRTKRASSTTQSLRGNAGRILRPNGIEHIEQIWSNTSDLVDDILGTIVNEVASSEALDVVKMLGTTDCNHFDIRQSCELNSVLSNAGCRCLVALRITEESMALGYLQLPPHTRTFCRCPLLRGIQRQVFENKASQAVVAANGIVAACSMGTAGGTLKEILSSTRVCCAYAPRPLTSPEPTVTSALPSTDSRTYLPRLDQRHNRPL